MTRAGMRPGLDHGEFQGEELGQERRPWGQAGADHARPWTEEGSVSLSSGQLLKGLWMGRAGLLVCDLVVPCSGCGNMGSLSTSQGGLEDQQEAHLASCSQVSVGSAMFQGSFGKGGGGEPPRACQGALPSSWVPGGSAPASGIPGLPRPPTLTLECLVRNLQCGTWGRLVAYLPGAGPFRPGCVGQKTGKPRGLPKKTWSVFLRRPPAPKPQTSLPPVAHPHPAPVAPSSLLHPPVHPAPGTGGSLLPPTTSGSR